MDERFNFLQSLEKARVRIVVMGSIQNILILRDKRSEKLKYSIIVKLMLPQNPSIGWPVKRGYPMGILHSWRSGSELGC
jgi:hypothetical protein